MATVNSNDVQFWQVPVTPLSYKQRTASHNYKSTSATSSRDQPASLHDNADLTCKRTNQLKCAAAATRHPGRDLEAQPENERVGAQGRHHDPTNRNEANGDVLSIEEILGPLLREEITAIGCHNSEDTLDTKRSCLGSTQSRLDGDVGDSQGTRDRPVILEDDEPGSSDPAADSEAASVPAFELSQLADPSSREAWWDIEDGCFVDEDLHPLLEQEGLASAAAQHRPNSRHLSASSSQDQTIPRDDNGTTQSASEEVAPQKDGRGGGKENASDLERDIQLAFEEQEQLSAASPSSPRPRRSAEPSYPLTDQGREQGRVKELGYSSRSRSQEQDKEGPREQQEQEVVAIDEMRQGVVEVEEEEGDDVDDNGEREQRRGKRQHQDEEISNGIHHSQSSGHSHDTNDENPRPAKRRRPPPVSTDKHLTAPLEHSPKPFLRQPHSLTLSSTTQPEIDESPPQADHGHLSTPVDDEHHYTTPTSRSPSVTVGSALVAEYREWPFQGFLKCITIGDQTTYTLEFSLSHIPEHSNLSLHSEVLSASSRESLVDAVVSRRAVTSRKPGKELTKNQESLLAKMVHEDKTWTEIGRHFPGHTLQSLKGNFFTKQGGKPRKRGRKPGVRGRGA